MNSINIIVLTLLLIQHTSGTDTVTDKNTDTKSNTDSKSVEKVNSTWDAPSTPKHYNRQMDRKEIYKYFIQEVESLSPITTSSRIIGRSSLGKDIFAVEIQHSNYYGGTVLIDAGQNGNEWQSVNTALYFLRYLLVHEVGLLMWLRVVFIPLVNPDGYEKAKDDVDFSSNVNDDGNCPGINIDMNFDVGPPPENTGCDHYQGQEYFSEVEAINIKNYIEALRDVKLYITLHSGKEAFIGVPFAYEDSEHSSIDMANNIHQAITSNLKNVSIKIGSLSHIFGRIFGGSALDWACSTGKVRHCIYMSVSTKGSLENQLVAYFQGLRYGIIQLQLTDLGVAMAFALEVMESDKSIGNCLRIQFLSLMLIFIFDFGFYYFFQ